MSKNFEWKPITDGLPPVGVPIMCSVIDHCLGNQPQLRYPCYYLKNRFTGNYNFCFVDIDNVLLPEVSEVVAWCEIPSPYEVDIE